MFLATGTDCTPGAMISKGVFTLLNAEECMSLHKKTPDVLKTGYLQWHAPLDTSQAHFKDMVKICSVPGQE